MVDGTGKCLGEILREDHIQIQKPFLQQKHGVGRTIHRIRIFFCPGIPVGNRHIRIHVYQKVTVPCHAYPVHIIRLHGKHIPHGVSHDGIHHVHQQSRQQQYGHQHPGIRKEPAQLLFHNHKNPAHRFSSPFAA